MSSLQGLSYAALSGSRAMIATLRPPSSERNAAFSPSESGAALLSDGWGSEGPQEYELPLASLECAVGECLPRNLELSPRLAVDLDGPLRD